MSSPASNPDPYQPPQAKLGEAPSRVRWIVFALAFGTSWLLYLHRYMFAMIKPAIAEEWGTDPAELGVIDSVFALFYVIPQIPIAIAADVAGVYLILPILIIIWCAGLAMHAWAPSIKALGVARAVLGLGQSAVFANLNKISPGWYPFGIRTTLQGLVGVFAGRFGGLSASLIFGFLLLGVFQMDWQIAVYLLAGVGILHAVLFRWLFRNTPREHPWVNPVEVALIEGKKAEEVDVAPPPKMTVGQMLKRVKPRGLLNLFVLGTSQLLSALADNIYSNWIPLFLFQQYALKYKEMGIYWALPLLGGALGGAAGGALNDWLIRTTGNRRWARSLVAFSGKGMAALLLFVALIWYDKPYIFCSFLFFVKFFGDWSLSTTWGTVSDIGGKATATVFSINNTIGGISIIVAPLVFGFMANEHGWAVVFVTAAVAYILCALCWLLINCTIPVIDESGVDGTKPAVN